MTERTVEVRVAVAVDADGRYCGCVESDGWYAPELMVPGDRDLPTTPRGWIERYGMLDEREDGEPMHFAWLTATLPIPEPAEPIEVRADVEEAG